MEPQNKGTGFMIHHFMHKAEQSAKVIFYSNFVAHTCGGQDFLDNPSLIIVVSMPVVLLL